VRQLRSFEQRTKLCGDTQVTMQRHFHEVFKVRVAAIAREDSEATLRAPEPEISLLKDDGPEVTARDGSELVGSAHKIVRVGAWHKGLRPRRKIIRQIASSPRGQRVGPYNVVVAVDFDSGAGRPYFHALSYKERRKPIVLSMDLDELVWVYFCRRPRRRHKGFARQGPETGLL